MHKKLRLFSVCMLMGLSACAIAPRQYEEAPPVTETQYACNITPRSKIRLKAEKITYISNYMPLGRAPNVEHDLLVVPEQLIHKWAENRFVVDGTADRQVRFFIKDAGITGRSIVTGSCFKQIMTEYTGRFEITVQFVDSEGRSPVETTLAVQRSEIVPTDLTQEEREHVWMQMTYDMLKSLSAKLGTDSHFCSASFNDYIER